ncbi:hypothetical protein [Ileibacterium valens]|uniref:hypothetical protein n=2 Tax=Ileibacterium valens TaxID=1862668 RepID=UPI002729FE70|nr:hypothetical protein [Ileibacterium valens]
MINMCEAIIQMQNSYRNEGIRIGERRGKTEGIQIGKTEGIEIGRNQELRKIAVKLLNYGQSKEYVANFLEISNAHLESILSEMNK